MVIYHFHGKNSKKNLAGPTSGECSNIDDNSHPVSACQIILLVGISYSEISSQLPSATEFVLPLLLLHAVPKKIVY